MEFREEPRAQKNLIFELFELNLNRVQATAYGSDRPDLSPNFRLIFF